MKRPKRTRIWNKRENKPKKKKIRKTVKRKRG